jgi:hypothetical protein
VLVPAGFTVMDDFERWLGRKFGHRLVNKSGEEAAAPGSAPAMGALAGPSLPQV